MSCWDRGLPAGHCAGNADRHQQDPTSSAGTTRINGSPLRKSAVGPDIGPDTCPDMNWRFQPANKREHCRPHSGWIAPTQASRTTGHRHSEQPQKRPMTSEDRAPVVHVPYFPFGAVEWPPFRPNTRLTVRRQAYKNPGRPTRVVWRRNFASAIFEQARNAAGTIQRSKTSAAEAVRRRPVRASVCCAQPEANW